MLNLRATVKTKAAEKNNIEECLFQWPMSSRREKPEGRLKSYLLNLRGTVETKAAEKRDAGEWQKEQDRVRDQVLKSQSPQRAEVTEPVLLIKAAANTERPQAAVTQTSPAQASLFAGSWTQRNADQVPAPAPDTRQPQAAVAQTSRLSLLSLERSGKENMLA